VFNRGGADFPECGSGPGIDDKAVAALKGFMAKRKSAGELVLLKAINALQGERYIAIAEQTPSQEAFVYGWLANRVGF
jgi:hypothetical protein